MPNHQRFLLHAFYTSDFTWYALATQWLVLKRNIRETHNYPKDVKSIIYAIRGISLQDTVPLNTRITLRPLFVGSEQVHICLRFNFLLPIR